jgi:hypothetical protein
MQTGCKRELCATRTKAYLTRARALCAALPVPSPTKPPCERCPFVIAALAKMVRGGVAWAWHAARTSTPTRSTRAGHLRQRAAGRKRTQDQRCRSSAALAALPAAAPCLTSACAADGDVTGAVTTIMTQLAGPESARFREQVDGTMEFNAETCARVAAHDSCDAISRSHPVSSGAATRRASKHRPPSRRRFCPPCTPPRPGQHARSPGCFPTPRSAAASACKWCVAAVDLRKSVARADGSTAGGGRSGPLRRRRSSCATP